MRNLIVLALLATISLPSWSLEVTVSAGGLQQAVGDEPSSVTTLTVSGTLDARDFRFIADAMPLLTSLDLSGVTISAYADPSGSLLESVSDYSANVLPQASLTGTPLSTLVLPANLEGIGQGALAGCRALTRIDLPATLTSIGAYAFSGTPLTTITVPSTVVALGKGALSRCEQLVSAEVHSATIGADAFKGATALSNVVLGREVSEIGDGAFAGCSSLATITLNTPCGVTSIGDEAFALSGLTAIDLESMPSLTAIGAWAFAGSALQTVTVPSTVTTLGEGAFYCTRQLTQAITPGLTTIGDFTFAGNTASLLSEVLAEGTEHIGAYAFYGDSTATSLTLPSTVTFIGTKAMAGMTGLERLDALCDVALLADSVWAGVDQPMVNLDTHRDNEISDAFALAEQWREFHILRDYLLGDVNLDTRINVRDITTTVDYIMEREPAVFVRPAADIVGDDVINVRDVTGLAELILDEEVSIIRAVQGNGVAAPSMPVVDDQLHLGDVVLQPGSSATLAVDLSSRRAYNALQLDVYLPDGLSLLDCHLTGRANGHVRTLGERADGSHRIVVYSPENAAIAAGDGAVLELEVQAGNDLFSGSTIYIDNITFADLVSDYAAAPCWAVVDNVTGVDDLAATSGKAWGEQGCIVIESPVAGTAQVAAMNGVMRQVTIEAGTTNVAADAGVYIVVMGGRSHKVIVK